MASDVLMPRLSDSMEEGTVLKWLVEEGGQVRPRQPLLELENHKADMTYAPPAPAPAPPAKAAPAAPSAGEAPAPPAGAKGAVAVKELTRLQKTVSRGMAESKATVPDFTLELDVDMTLCIGLRDRLKEQVD